MAVPSSEIKNPIQRLLQRPLPAWLPLPFCDGEALLGYNFIKTGFKLCTFTYYNGIHCNGIAENLPPPGVPTILCFNHSNGLVDPMVVIRALPRMIRFVAKDTLWSVKSFRARVIHFLVATTGAVPVQRKEEHGGSADAVPMFESVTEALKKGQCIGVAPEGNSKWRTMLDTPLKPGVALMAVEAVLGHMGEDEKFEVRIVPCGLAWFGRERMRSEVLVSCGKPIIVNAQFLHDRGITGESNLRDARRACAKDIMDRLTAGLEELCVVVQPPEPAVEDYQTLEGDWSAFAPGITAARIYLRGTAHIPLNLWAGAVKDFSNALAKPENQALTERVRMYRQGLNALGIPDTCVPDLESTTTNVPDLESVKHLKCKPLVQELAMHVLRAVAFAVLALPGLVFWLPVMALSTWLEWKVIRRGVLRDRDTGLVIRIRRNFDTIAEGKMTIGFVLNFIICCVLWFYIWFTGHGCGAGFLMGWGVLPALMWMTLRLLEEASSSTRSILALSAMLRLAVSADGSGKLGALIDHRRSLQEALKGLLPSEGPRPIFAGPPMSATPYLRRCKKDPYDSMNPWEDLDFLAMHVKPARSGSAVDASSTKLLQSSGK